MPGRFPAWWAVALLLWIVMLPLDTQAAGNAPGWSDDDDLLESDDDDLLSTARTPPAATRNRTILLDIYPVDMERDLIGRIEARVLEIMRSAQDLGVVYGREALGEGQLYQHVVRTCQDVENLVCMARFAARTEATLAVFGQIRDLDDIYLLELYLLDVRSSRLRESVRVTIPKPAEDLEIIENAAQAVCRLVRHYGCTSATRRAILAPAVAPSAQPQTAQPDARISDDDDEPLPVAAPAPAGPPDDEPLWDDDDFDDGFDDEPAVRAVPAARTARPTPGPKAPRTLKQKTYINTGWTFVALSAAALAGGGATTALMFQAKSDYDAAQPGEGAKARSARDRALTMQWTSLGLYSAAGAFAAVGVPLLVLGYQDSPADEFVLLPATTPEHVGLVLRTRF